jgi:hypothetical protein
VAGSLFFCFAPLWIRFSALEYLYTTPGIVLSIVAAWQVLRWFERKSAWTAACVGLLSGLATWCTPMTSCLLLPIGVAFVWGARRRLGDVASAAAGFLVGLSPWLAVFAIQGRSAFHSLGTTQSTATAFKDSIKELLPVALSLRASGHPPGWVGWAVFIAALAGLPVFLAMRRFELACCAASLVLWPFVVVALKVPVLPSAYRYGYLMAPALLVLICYLASLLRLSVLVAIAVVLFVSDTAWYQTDHFASGPMCPPSFAKVADYLTAQQRTAVWGAYWLAAPLGVCEYPRLAVGVAAERGDSIWAHQAAAAGHTTYVVFAGKAMDQAIGSWAHLHDPRADRVVIAPFALWLLSQRATPGQLDLRGGY